MQKIDNKLWNIVYENINNVTKINTHIHGSYKKILSANYMDSYIT